MTTPVLHIRRERGAALLETALVMPIVLLVAVGIFEFGRAYQHWQVLTNAAREGARVAVLPGADVGTITARVKSYMNSGQLSKADSATVAVTPVTLDLGGGATAAASSVAVNYPFEFIVLQPIAQLVVTGSRAGAPLTMTATSVMRIE
ncbi:MAG TPA: TadE family protein [Vicinamibacterales bacterium]|nr:TadE family protein [Vicinamibacterales bacterium]